MKKNTDKTYTTVKEINGVTYRAQFNGIREAIRASQQCKGDELKLSEYLLENVIVEPPGVKIDDFEDIDEYRQVTNFAASVMAGRFRGGDESGTSQGESKA